MLSPASMIRPVGLHAPCGSNCRIESAVSDLPDPLSPTNASVSPRFTLKDTPSTTRLVPNATERFSTSSSFSLALFSSFMS